MMDMEVHERRRPRRFPGQRWLRIGVRTAHIGCVAMVMGAVVFGGEARGWLVGLVVTGALLVAEELYRYGLDWLRYLSAWAVVLKIGLLAAGLMFPERLPALLWAALIVGGVISHAPGRVRQFPLWGAPGPCATDRPAEQPGGTVPDRIEDRIREALRGVLDPEVGVNVVDLGLVYEIEVEDGRARIDMTMTTAACPMSDWIRDTAVREVERSVEGVDEVEITFVWEPPWSPEKMSPAAKRELGWS